ncbi:hydantoinase B/oxoprolinase family protein [Aestuariivirga sp. YIM B02566]|uniref:hydantoinase B/oxoprolinase family protein n=1 Tax=Taklimakanibacter albus TaxID=2800327 RepID=UPI0032B213BA
MTQQIDKEARLDGVQLAILAHRLEGVTRKMANTLLRTARSGVINIARDFSCCIVTAGAELLVANEGLPIHVLAGPDIMARAMKEHSPVLKRGDAFLNNSPYHGCSHAADHTLLVPVMDHEGTHRFTVLAKAHQADIGNSIATTYHGAARDVYEEGALIFPSVKVQENYETDQDFVRMCRMRIRVPDQWWGDFLAMVASARIGEREIMVLAEEVGWDTLENFSATWLDYSEKRMVEAVTAMPGGRMTRTSTHDRFPGAPEEGIPVTVDVSLNPREARIAVDLTRNPDCLPCGLNLSEACARTAAMVGIFNSIDHRVPKNAGSCRRIDVKLRENCVVGIPRHPTSTSVATTNVADRVANAVQAAIAEIANGAGMAECGAVIAPAGGVISGVDPAGKEFVNHIFLGETGGAAAPRSDAWLVIGHVGGAGMCNLDSVELDEMRQPLRVFSRKLVPDTEGAGRFRGAPSMSVEFGPVGCDMQVAYVSDGTVNAARGVRGGGAGGKADQFRVRRDGTLQRLDACAQVTIHEGERLLSISCGGGGYGNPAEREAETVARDVAEKWISAQRARDVYRVAVSEDGSLDRNETVRLRHAER